MACSCGAKSRCFTPSDDDTCSCTGTSDDSSLQVAKTCHCNPCMATRVSDLFQNMSCISVDSLDIQLLSQLQMLAHREKKMKKQIQEMEQREKIYKKILAQADEMWAMMEGSYESCLCDLQNSGEGNCVKYQIMNEQLVEENKRLAAEIKEVKKEMKKCKKQISEPLHAELKNKRCRCAQLEDEIHKQRSNMAAKDKSHLNDMNGLQNQLSCTCRAFKDLGSCNDQLRQEVCQLKSKCMEVEKEIANQRISAERTRQRMHEAICEEKAKTCLSICPGNEPNVKDTLSEIGRKLSATIVQVNACFECNTLPTDLKETVQGIRNLVSFVNDVTSGKPPTSQAKGGEEAPGDGGEQGGVAAPPAERTAKEEPTESSAKQEPTESSAKEEPTEPPAEEEPTESSAKEEPAEPPTEEEPTESPAEEEPTEPPAEEESTEPPEDTTADETSEEPPGETEEDTTETEEKEETVSKGSKCSCKKPKAAIDLIIEAEICLDIEKAKISSYSSGS